MTAAVNYISSLKKSRLAATSSFLQIDDVTTHILIHAEGLSCSVQAVLAINSHRPHIVGSDDELPPESSVVVVAWLSSCCGPSRSVSAPPLPGKLFPLFCIYYFFLKYTCILQFLPPEDSILPPHVSSPVLQTRAESDAYSRAPLLPSASRDGAAVVCLPPPLGRTIRHVGGFS